MNARRIPLSEVDADAFDNLTRESFFASRGFLDLWRAQDGRPVVWMVADGGRPIAVLPGVEFGVWPFHRFTAMPDGCYGGVFVTPEAALDHGVLRASLLDAVARHGYGRCHLFGRESRVQSHPSFEEGVGRTRWVRIGEAGWEPPDVALRSDIRHADRLGVSPARFEPEHHLAGFQTLAEDTYRRLGLRPRYTRAFYRALAVLSLRDPRVVWRWCEWQGQPVCSHIYFVERGMIQAWQSHLDRRFKRLHAGPLMRFVTCREARAQGIEWLDLGASPPGAAGLEAFKLRWGGELVQVAMLLRRTRMGAWADAHGGRAHKRAASTAATGASNGFLERKAATGRPANAPAS